MRRARSNSKEGRKEGKKRRDQESAPSRRPSALARSRDSRWWRRRTIVRCVPRGFCVCFLCVDVVVQSWYFVCVRWHVETLDFALFNQKNQPPLCSHPCGCRNGTMNIFKHSQFCEGGMQEERVKTAVRFMVGTKQGHGTVVLQFFFFFSFLADRLFSFSFCEGGHPPVRGCVAVVRFVREVYW